jgi:hypothetical protein
VHDSFSHQPEPTGLDSAGVTSSIDTYGNTEFYATSDAQHQRTNPAMYTSHSFHAPPTSGHEPSFYQQHEHIGNPAFGWTRSGAERPLSPEDVDEQYPAYVAHRANSFPAIPSRRVSAPNDLSAGYTNARGYAIDPHYHQQHHLLAQHYPAAAEYAQSGWAPHSNGRVPSTTMANYSQPWFNTPLAYVREEEDALGAQSHARHPFQPG